MNYRINLLIGFILLLSFPIFSENIYLRYDANCMDRYEYRLNDNQTGNGLISYYLKMDDASRVMLEVGVESIKRVKRLPNGTKTCKQIGDFKSLVEDINGDRDRVYIVRRIGGYYTVSPVHLATLMTDNRDGFSMFGNEFDMTYTSNDYGVMENNLATRASLTKAYFLNSGAQYCANFYQIKKIPEETCKPYIDITYVEGIGIIEEKAGFTEYESENNVLRLVKINDINFEEYLQAKCTGRTPKVEVQPEIVQAYKPSTTNREIAVAQEEKPAGYDIIFANKGPVEPEYQLAGSEILYSYEERLAPLETFRPKGSDCNDISSPGIHIIQNSQTLYGIARKYGLTIGQLREWNGLKQQDLIYPCDKLLVLPPRKDHVENKNGAIVYEKTAAPTTPSAFANVKTENLTDILTPKSPVRKTTDCSKSSSEGIHIVQKGETLYSIAKSYGVSVKELSHWNRLEDEEKLKICTSLYVKSPLITQSENQEKDYKIPAAEISTGYTNASNNTNISKGAANLGATDKMWNAGIEYHIVQKGETLSSLAEMYGFTLARFKDINGLGDSNIISIGQVLKTGNCLCPVNGDVPSAKAITPKAAAKTNISKTSQVKTQKARAERSTELAPVPAPYDYETESILKNVKPSSSINTRNGRKIHTVKENETLAIIADTYGIPLEVLRKLNNMEKGEIVIPHQKIYLE